MLVQSDVTERARTEKTLTGVTDAQVSWPTVGPWAGWISCVG